MEAPVITRSRRPFLAPIWLAALLGVLAMVFALAAWRQLGSTTLVLVRHAEKELGSIDDPPLSAQGEQRAERLSQMLGQVQGAGRVGGIYVLTARRTQQTAAPLAARLRMTPVVLATEDAGEIADRLLRDHHGGAALVVANGGTLPALVKKLAGIDIPSIPDGQYDDIYIVSVPTVGHASLLQIKY